MKTKTVGTAIFLVLFMLLSLSPFAYAQIKLPNDYPVSPAISKVEVYRNCLEIGDQLYLIMGAINYSLSTLPPITTADSYIVRLMQGATERGSTTFYPYRNKGYDYGVASIYFPASSAPAWNPVPPATTYTMYLQGNPALHWLDNTATTAMSSALAYDAPVYTDETTASNNATINDMTLMPVAPLAGDTYYFGSTGMFDILTVNVGTNGNWTGSYVWEYYNGSYWLAPESLVDGTTGFTAGAGNRSVTYTCPDTWQPTLINGVSLYWLRFRIASISAIVAQPLGTQSWTNTSSVIPNTSQATFDLWYDGTTTSATKVVLMGKLRALAQEIEDDWGGTTNLIESVAGVPKLTSTGEDYFTNAIPNLRLMCPDLFTNIITSPDFEESAFVRDFYVEGANANLTIYGINWSAQTFTALSSYTIKSIELKALRSGTTPGVVTVSIRATVGGLPAGTDLVSGTTNGDNFTTYSNGSWYEVTFVAGGGLPSETAIVKGTTYAIVVNAAAGNINNYILWRANTAGSLANAQVCSSVNSGVAWVAVPAQDAMFAVHATGGYSLSYREKLAGRLVGTPLDVTPLATDLGMSRMWLSSLVWIILCCLLPAVYVCRLADSFKPASSVFMLMLPLGALAGFLYLEIAIVGAFFCGVAAVYIFFYRGAP